jgi:hypothetical protein
MTKAGETWKGGQFRRAVQAKVPKSRGGGVGGRVWGEGLRSHLRVRGVRQEGAVGLHSWRFLPPYSPARSSLKGTD